MNVINGIDYDLLLELAKIKMMHRIDSDVDLVISMRVLGINIYTSKMPPINESVITEPTVKRFIKLLL
jgi:hypothetical protein